MIRAYAAFEAKGELLPFEYDPGELHPHEVEIDVRYCGICHSDLSVMDNAWGITRYPVVPGHEVVGLIGRTGRHVTHLRPGQTVGLGWHSGYCHECPQCHTGNQNLCDHAQATIIGHHGGFADQVRADARSVVPIPPSIDEACAGPLFCGGVTVFNPLVQYHVKPTDTVAVIGIGGLGHLALQFLNAWGCDVTAFTSSGNKREEILKMGAHHVLDSRDNKALEMAADRFDLIISTVNVKLDWNLYLNTLKPHGRLHFVGAVLDSLDIAAYHLTGRQRAISGSSVGSPSAITAMLDFAARHNIKPVIEKFSFTDINQAVERLRSGQARYRVVLCH